MAFHERLTAATAAEEDDFVNIPLIKQALRDGVPKDMYLAYLEQAYHHVKHTCHLLALAASRCGDGDAGYQEALFEYINEEKGHDEWILDDIAALGGDAGAVRKGEPDIPCAVMVGYTYYAIEHISPYCLLGMVHVLEGMSVLLAGKAAASIRRTIGDGDDVGGFTYLASHGEIDIQHVAFFKKTIETISDAEKQKAVIETARVIYRLFGDIFRSLGKNLEGNQNAA
ncbi:MAG: iron-containing redox enzyme family protein [Rhodospirillales bacterium]|nr:iron-containing redox enzyme family protein [Rhodospirillales bacterium]HIJ42596.1 iron-containing redox enzyme family protein [Rhodospirillaceae bacterium]HIJ94015.1 iron-containing redox enzyme family protein [Rhodospirillaceae bacterium]HJP55165.1 iron-containing redox enzyme family protein [Rhodospirillales bacterium]